MVSNDLQLIDVHRSHDDAFSQTKVLMDASANPPNHTCPLIKTF